jgi:hypothetical protein
MKIAIVNRNTLGIESTYEDVAPAQQKYGGPWGSSEMYVHLEIPEGFDTRCLEVIDTEGVLSIGENQTVKNNYVLPDAIAATENAIANARAFGSKLINEFAAENLRLGITAAGKTKSVRQAMSQITDALNTGSLYDAIDEARLIPAPSKDATFITDVRLLAFINKIEAYLNQPLSQAL